MSNKTLVDLQTLSINDRETLSVDFDVRELFSDTFCEGQKGALFEAENGVEIVPACNGSLTVTRNKSDS